MPPIWVGFWVRNSLNKDPSSADFPESWMGFPEIGKILPKIDGLPPKFIIKEGITATVDK